MYICTYRYIHVFICIPKKVNYNYVASLPTLQLFSEKDCSSVSYSFL